jgi:RNA polymerase sigma-70 factor (TIGR02943 family)
MQNHLSDSDQWVDLYGNILYRFTLIRVRDTSVAEDLVQEAFLAALKSRQNFKGQSTEKSWLIGILKHKIMDYYRKNSRNNEFNSFVDEAKGFKDFFDNIEKEKRPTTSWGADPAQNLQNKEFLAVFHKCLENIPPKLAKVFTLRELDGVSTEDICKDLNITATNLWVILHRARLGLQNCLEHNWFKGQNKGI